MARGGKRRRSPWRRWIAVSPQERVERSIAGRVVLSLAIPFVLLCLAIWNMPSSRLHDDLVKDFVRPAIGIMGLEQNWAVFAPDPRRQVEFLEGRLTFADGTTRV